MKLAPIVLFVYNRPWHTRQTIIALQQNELANDSDLIIYADGPKDVHDKKITQEVNDYIRTIEGFKSVRIIKRDNNLGLAQNIIDGVSTIVNKYGRVIVLEDDIVTSKYFLKYMNRALDTYDKIEKVMHVSGYMVPINPSGITETFLTKTMYCWGWGTWKESWNHFNRDCNSIIEVFNNSMIHEFNLYGCENIWRQILENKSGVLKTWAVFWYASIFLKNGLCLNPRCSLTKNIGLDNSGTNCGFLNIFDTTIANYKPKILPRLSDQNPVALNKLKAFYRKKNNPVRTLFNSIVNFCKIHF